jgi:hypothetical protein
VRYTTATDDPAGLPPDRPDVAAVLLVGREVGGTNTGTTADDLTSHAGLPPSRAG